MQNTLVATISELLPYLAIPVVSGLIGWGTNYLAIRMLFEPIEFRGYRRLGWQGIIPRRVHKMAAICVELMLDKLIDARELYTRLDPADVAEAMRPELDARLDDIIDEVVAKHFPQLWRRVPAAVRQRARDRVSREFPAVVERMMADIHRGLDGYLDLRQLVVDAFVHDRALLNELFLRCGAREFPFIARSGLLFGFLFGVPLSLLTLAFSPLWVLPVGGLVVGWATNWLALKMIFNPLEPRGIGPLRWQGMFLKRQPEVAKAYAGLVAQQILVPRTLISGVLEGRAVDDVYDMILGHLHDAVDGALGRGRIAVELASGARRYHAMREAIATSLMEAIPAALRRVEDYAAEALNLEEEIRARMVALPAPDYLGVLRPIFLQEETTLIGIGAALGLVVGLGQALLYF